MLHSLTASLRLALLIPMTLLAVGLQTTLSLAQIRLYTPIPIQLGKSITDRLTDKDIPTGQGGFARDYALKLATGDQVVIDLLSDEFDTIVVLMDQDGTTLVENDDGPDGTTNSLLFTRITKGGNYIVRVRAFGETAGGTFKLKITRLKPA